MSFTARTPARTLAAGAAVTMTTALLAGPATSPAVADPRNTTKTPVAVGYGGAVSSVDPVATAVGLEVLR